MGEELDARAEEARGAARRARAVALVSSGDAGVHGMAARTLALARRRRGHGDPGRDRRARRRRAARRAAGRRLGDALAVATCTCRGRRSSAA